MADETRPRGRLRALIEALPGARGAASAGMGAAGLSEHSRGLAPRTRGLAPTVSVCPYCAVGCSQLVYHRDGKVLEIEGNPASPINGGTLCPKGAATSQLINNSLRLTTVRYRAPYADRWEERPLAWAMERIAQLVKQTRDETFIERDERGRLLNHTKAIAHLGGATLDNEENYLIKKLWTGLGIVAVENQARI